MWYLLIGSAGIASTLYALLRAAQAEARAIRAETTTTQETDRAERWKAETLSQKGIYLDQIRHRDAEIHTLKIQRKQAIDALENSSCPGSLRSALRVSLGLEG